MIDLKTVYIFVQTSLMKNFFLLFAISLFFMSCGSDGECKECNKKKDEPVKDTVVDSMEEALKNDSAVTVGMTKEQKINHVKIVQKYGEQWDFCKCVVANDSITDAAEKGNLTDAQYDKLMVRWEYVDGKCKELTTFENQTPDERAKHDKKVIKCLKEHGLRK